MSKFIVVGFYHDTNRPFVRHVPKERVSSYDYDDGDNDGEREQAMAAARCALRDLRSLMGLSPRDKLDASVVEVLHYGIGALFSNEVIHAEELLKGGQDWQEKFAGAEDARDACGLALDFMRDLSDTNPDYKALVAMLERMA